MHVRDLDIVRNHSCLLSECCPVLRDEPERALAHPDDERGACPEASRECMVLELVPMLVPHSHSPQKYPPSSTNRDECLHVNGVWCKQYILCTSFPEIFTAVGTVNA